MPGSVIPPCGESLPPKQNRPGGCITTAYGLGIFGWLNGDDGSRSLADLLPLRAPPLTASDKAAIEEADWSDPMEEDPAEGSSKQNRRDAPGQPGFGEELGHDLSNELAKRLPAATTSAATTGVGSNDAGALVGIIDDVHANSNLPTSRLNTVEAGATMVEVGPYFYWSYTYVYVQHHRSNQTY